ncbi:DUF5682 family protein [Amycolatopsis sp. YIM 10]|uniref:DUF5682 family protein n=1 Tax=Amycolatopsis sp. YIM 10 TaxID=2653857 RepID=UPI0012907B38|nr:DUF5682 family protein [Amycolatopsis sp. YIM 10]QFU93238.1 hypothetical protein YIM_40505 [Amycolatopsis sp. YIM 10]
MAATFLGVRHHSPACARLAGSVIDRLRPAHVLVEGPAELNGRLGELLLGHELPIAVFSHYRDDHRTMASWSPFCEYSPEWIALTTGLAVGAQVRFIDLPAWHPALATRRNRYTDAEDRYADAVARLCTAFAVDNVDSLWDQLFEVEPPDGLPERLTAYFDLLRGGSEADEDDAARERYMASWVRAAVADAGSAPVVVVTGGFHRPALERLAEGGSDGWPVVPSPPPGATGESFLVPYSFKRLDAFTGYQSGMPSPEYYQLLWESGPDAAAAGLIEAVVTRLRRRGLPVSTADLVTAHALAAGLANLRGHPRPARADILDALASALIADDLEQRLPWSTRGPLRAGAHPAVVEMVAALSGERTGRLHPGTPAPPLVRAVTTELAELGLDGDGPVHLDLGRDGHRSRVLHRLRVLDVPGFERRRGPCSGADPVGTEHWRLTVTELRLPMLIEAGAYGGTPADAAAAVLAERAAGAEVGELAAVLFDAVLCGVVELAEQVLAELRTGLAAATELGALGRVLAVVLGLWRHGDLWHTAGSEALAEVLVAAVPRVLWLAEGVRGVSAPADQDRLDAMVALRDTLRYATPMLDRAAVLAACRRIAADPGAPPDLRGAAFGLVWASGEAGDPVLAIPGGPRTAGDWLAGLFALARAQVLAGSQVLDVLDDLVSGMGDEDFLIALPALRQAFAYFPPYERRQLAAALRRPAPAPPPVPADPGVESTVDKMLRAEGLC